MNAWLKRIEAWRSRRRRRGLQWWEQTRVKGKTRFVLKTALSYGVIVVGATDFLDYLSYGGHYVSLRHLIQHIVTGGLVALGAWSSWEAKYQKALREALPSSKTLPQSGTEQSPFP